MRAGHRGEKLLRLVAENNTEIRIFMYRYVLFELGARHCGNSGASRFIAQNPGGNGLQVPRVPSCELHAARRTCSSVCWPISALAAHRIHLWLLRSVR